MGDIYDEIRQKIFKICRHQDLLSQPVRVRARALTTEEAIGNPEADDFPLQKGKERLMQAEFLNAAGQAFTDQFGDFEGILEDVLQMPLENNFRRAVFVSTLNAVLRHTNQVTGTIHCHDSGPGQCAVELVDYLKAEHGVLKIAQIGFQPRMVEYLAPEFQLRVLDLDPDNIGTMKFNVSIEGPEKTEDAMAWADLLFVTGTTIVNGTIENFLGRKPVIFYGTTIAGAAHLMNWDRFCARST
ncbi:MAG: hypothetical protein DRH32_07790 [Deltaproteobacteria bacterium]|nr:MAG: hypothetical protein DRH32_07790 [Deltaproteobacteria bacterium]